MIGVKGFVLGHKHSKETKEKISKKLRNRVKFNCDMCGVESDDKPSSYDRKVNHFCSSGCYSEFRRTILKPEEQNSYRGGGMSADEKLIRIKARSDVNHAIRDGKLDRMPCVVCGNERSEGHHEDYSKPLDVIWLCRKHHREVHKNKELLGKSNA